MKKEEYLKLVLEQIRCTKVHGMVREELSQHIDDQAECYEEYGLRKEEAMKKAVERMGNPVETGVELDRIHRPKLEWRMLIFTAVLCVIGLMLQFSMNKIWGEQQSFSMKEHLLALGIGLAVMFAIYFLDYSFLVKYAREAAVIFGIIGLLQCLFGVTAVSGRLLWLSVPWGSIDLVPFLYLYVPIYASLLYRCRGAGYSAVLKAMLWMAPPLFLAWYAPSLPTLFNLLYILAAVFSIAAAKDWFQIQKKAVLGILWMFLAAAPLSGAAYMMHFGAGYQGARIQSWLGIGSAEGQGFVLSNVRRFMQSSHLFGKCDAVFIGVDTGVSSIFASEQMIFTHIVGYYGVLAGIILGAVIALFIWKMLMMVTKQKNQAGMLIGAGSAVVFAVQFLQATLENLSFLPTTSTYFPLLSYGFGSTVVSFILLGFVMSVYRYQNIVPQQVVKKRRWKLMLLP
ncbi:MAG: FtsW/RodA/SpoVE family cell cycle protein [Eubacterium sp.]|nr:FtsW/RodA/SpoVE family cell cycle protein [Eubacterium sp.]